MILIIDNYDSFTYNLQQFVGEAASLNKTDILVKRNDKITLDEIKQLSPSHIIISPGPCTPKEAGISVEVVKKFAGRIPILGVCLGHQCIAAAFDCEIVHAPELFHGKTSELSHTDDKLFNDVPSPFTATRYHSLIANTESLEEHFKVTARTNSGLPMAIKHKEHANLYGLQFHPESIMTEPGKQILGNFIEIG